MAKIIEQEEYIVDSGLGPLRVTQSKIADFDIDDIVTQATESQLLKLKMLNIAVGLDPESTIDRPPVNINGISLGGKKV